MTADFPPAGYLWGDFQSAAQLSVALNAAFATLSSFLGNDIQREVQKLRTEIRTISKDKTNHLLAGAISPATELRLLIGHSLSLKIEYEILLDIFVRPSCIIGLIISIFLLAKSSFLYRETISNFYIFLSVISYVPTISAVLLSIAVNAWLYIRISRSRIRITSKSAKIRQKGK